MTGNSILTENLPDDKYVIVVFCGVSGSGKSYIEEYLNTSFPNIFSKWKQVTTRAMRSNETQDKQYRFVSEMEYEGIKDSLVGRVGHDGGMKTLFTSKYGSIPDFDKTGGKVFTIILSEVGLTDLNICLLKGIRSTSNPDRVMNNDNTLVIRIGLDVDYNDLNDDDKRIGRDISFIEEERNVLKGSDLIIKRSNGRYISPELIVYFLETYFKSYNNTKK